MVVDPPLDKQLVVKIICSSCGYPQESIVPVMDFTDNQEHFKTCEHCHKWLVEFFVEEKPLDEEGEKKTD